MKLHLLLAYLFIGFHALSQVTITSTDFADGGDTVRMSTATDPGLDYSLTGANYTWDFSSLVATSQELKEFSAMGQASILAAFTFGGFAPSAYQATNFRSSTDLPLGQITAVLPVSITDVNLFSKNTSSAITSVGYSLVVEGTEVPFRSDTIETRYELPLNFGDTYNSRGYSNLDLNPITNAIWRQYKTRDVIVDGWGAITTPFGTFDALRLTHTISELDSILFEIGGVATWIPIPVPDQIVYEWWTPNELEPVLRVESSVVFGTAAVTKIEYRDSFDPALVSIEDQELNVSVYPNPTSDELVVEFDQIGANYSVIDAHGKVQSEGSLKEYSNHIDVSFLTQGMYQLIVRSANHFSIVPFVKK